MRSSSRSIRHNEKAHTPPGKKKHFSSSSSSKLRLSLLLINFLCLISPVLPQTTRRLQATIGIFEAIDTDHDGVITKHEYNRAVEMLKDGLSSSQESAMEESNEKDTKKKGPVLRASAKAEQDDKKKKSEEEEDLGLKFIPAFINSMCMILATEVGDKTFFIAAVLSMRNDRMAVFTGAFLALCCMTILSSMMGLVLPSLIPRQYTHIISGVLFLYFGIRLCLDARNMSDSGCSHELQEVEEELLQSTKKQDDVKDGNDSTNQTSSPDIEDNYDDTNRTYVKQRKQLGNADSFHSNTANDDDTNRTASHNDATKKPTSTSSSSSSSHWEKIFIQSLTLTFLAEWGDRSQIATIALAAAKDPYGVNIGAMLGHFLCTGMAVLGGRMLAASIKEKTVNLCGGLIFLVFGVHSLFFEEVSF